VTATAPPLPSTVELDIALDRMDELALRIADSRALDCNETERHANLDDLQAIYAAVRTHQRRHGEMG
jgi:hypothetical protein